MSSRPPRTNPVASVRNFEIVALVTALAAVSGCSLKSATGFARINVGGDDAAVTDGAAPPMCSDRLMNGDETDVDCGGGCAACAKGRRCKNSTDCAIGECTSALCQISACANAIHDGNETGVDCGGPDCAACDFPSRCVAEIGRAHV